MGQKAKKPKLMNQRAKDARRRLELPVLVAAGAVIPVLFVEEMVDNQTVLAVAGVLNWVTWSVFFVEFVVVAALTKQPIRYAKRNWLDTAVVVLTVPVSVHLLGLFRLARLARLIRLVRVAAVAAKLIRTSSKMLGRRSLGYALAGFVLLATVLAALFSYFEGVSLGDGLWWTVVTVTTVGYGDIFPETAPGRATASVLMFAGIGIVAVLTANIAAVFVEADDEPDHLEVVEELRSIKEQLNHLEQLVTAGSGTDTPPSPSSRGEAT